MSIIQDHRPPEVIERELRLLHLCQRVWTYAVTTKSDLARDYADEVAEGASRGFLTTLVAFGSDVYGRLWKVTEAGVAFLRINGDRIAADEVENYGESICSPNETA